MSDSTTPKTDQQLAAEKLLRDMQAAVGGELLRNEGDRLVLRHPPKAPKPRGA